MSPEYDFKTIDEVCAHLSRYAETIERLAASKHVAVGEHIDALTESVVEAGHQLSEVAQYVPLDDGRATVVLNLLSRYRNLEGLLKEVRNDRINRGQTAAGPVRSLRSLKGEQDR